MPRLSSSIGRQRVTRVLNPAQAGYVRDMQAQMKVIRDNLKKVIDGIEGITPRALRFGMQPIFDESQRLVPVRSGVLKRSGFLEVRRTSRGVVSAAVGYAKGGSPDYAVIVHERTDVHHQAPTQAKYLEEAVNRHISNVPERTIGFIQRSTGLSN